MLRRAQSSRPRSRARRAPRVREGRCAGPRDEQLRRQSVAAHAVRTGPPGARHQHGRRSRGSRGCRRHRARRRRRGAARRAARAVRTDEPRRSARYFSRADGGTRRRRCRSVHPRDLCRSPRDRAGDSGGAGGRTRAFSGRADDGRRGLSHAVWGLCRRRRSGARSVGRRHHRPQLLGRSADDSRVHREDGDRHDAEVERPAERRHAARGRGSQDVHGQPGIPGDLRAASRTGRSEGGRRLLRDNARSRSRDERGDSSAPAAVRPRDGGRAEASSRRSVRDEGDGQGRWSPRRRAGPLRRAFALGRQDRGRNVRVVSGDRSASRCRCDADAG